MTANAGISIILKNAVALAEVLDVTVPSNWTDIANKITVLSDPSSGIILEYGSSFSSPLPKTGLTFIYSFASDGFVIGYFEKKAIH